MNEMWGFNSSLIHTTSMKSQEKRFPIWCKRPVVLPYTSLGRKVLSKEAMNEGGTIKVEQSSAAQTKN